jgi:hypothetical protein
MLYLWWLGAGLAHGEQVKLRVVPLVQENLRIIQGCGTGSGTGTGSVFNRVCGSGSVFGIRIRIREGKK